MDLDYVGSLAVRSTQACERAGRPAIDVHLHGADGELRLSVDAESGIWTGLATEGVLIIVDELILDPPDVDVVALGMLDWLADIDLVRTQTPTTTTQRVITAVELASGMTARVLAQDDDTDELRLVLLDGDGDPRAVVSRTRGHRAPAQRIFGGAQIHEIDPEWDYVVDTSSDDRRRAQMILNALPEIIDGRQRQRD